ncbi:LysR family transcriptional regulator [Ahrensia kielensis]|uniref:LysR family transcriptional regulator n=1 Tax=Ahrensia kielensis TaxID=76980 RepID=A0ABU9T576_9HYPH
MERVIKQFLAVAQTGSITAACHKLNVTQPTVTVGIRKLEARHGMALFERSSQGMRLTEAGRILRDHALVVERVENQATTSLSALRGGKQEPLRIGCGHAWWDFFVRDVVADYHRDQPNADIHAAVFNTLDGISKLNLCDISLFIGHYEPLLAQLSNYHFEALFHVEDAYFARSAHPLGHRACTREDVKAFDTMDTVPVEYGHRDISDQFVRSSQVIDNVQSNRTIFSTNSMTIVLDLLRSSDAIIVYPESSTRFFAANGIARLNVKDPEEAKPVGMYVLEEKRTDGNLKNLQEKVRLVAGHS